MINRDKTAMVVIGGGMRSAYGAGFIYALGTQLGITHADIMVASSGSTGAALYFITGQYEEIKGAWCDALPTVRFISWMRRPIMVIPARIRIHIRFKSSEERALALDWTSRTAT